MGRGIIIPRVFAHVARAAHFHRHGIGIDADRRPTDAAESEEETQNIKIAVGEIIAARKIHMETEKRGAESRRAQKGDQHKAEPHVNGLFAADLIGEDPDGHVGNDRRGARHHHGNGKTAALDLPDHFRHTPKRRK